MTPKQINHTLTVLFFGGLLWIAACSSQPNENIRTAAPSPQQATDGDARLRALEAEVRAQSPLRRNPEALETGNATPVGTTRDEGEPKPPANCPSSGFTIVRAEAGTKCDDYQAEISAFEGRCVGDCDRKSIDLSLIRSAGAQCVEFCQKKGCSKASFIPPPNGAAAYGCYTDPNQCPKAECPTREYGSLIDTRRVFNCVCRDIIPT
ncbi:MAG TPA: hypothetical protein VFZ40_10990 [Pyrinomonadaceae bacterium]